MTKNTDKQQHPPRMPIRQKGEKMLLTNQKFGAHLTLDSAKSDTPPATRSVQIYSEYVYLMPYTRAPISITAEGKGITLNNLHGNIALPTGFKTSMLFNYQR